MITWALYTWLCAGFHTATLPIRAGALGRLPAMLVKLKGVSANTKPSSGRYSTRFQVGCGLYMGWSR